MSRFLFPRWSNALLPLLAIVGGIAPLYVAFFVAYGFSPKTLEVGYQPEQPVPFSHALHAGELGMDCRYCHNTVERASHAAVPATQTCMNCHTLVKPESPKLEGVLASYETGLPIEWVKVHHVADYAYFSHQAHVNRGVGCVSCHGRIDQMEEHAASLDMPQETVAHARSFGGARDQPRYVGDDEFMPLVADDAQLWAERGKGISADLGLRIGDGVDKGRLARVGQTDKPRIGQQLEPQPHPHFLTRPAGAMLAWGAVGAGLVACVAATAVAAAQEDQLFALFRQIGKQAAILVIIKDLGADRDLDDKVGAARAGAVASRSGRTALCLEMLGIAKVDQRVETGHRFEDDVAALAAVAAVGAAIFDIFFTPERHRAGAAVAGLDEDLGLVEEMHGGAFRAET